jgi:hypothetical protein
MEELPVLSSKRAVCGRCYDNLLLKLVDFDLNGTSLHHWKEMFLFMN